MVFQVEIHTLGGSMSFTIEKTADGFAIISGERRVELTAGEYEDAYYSSGAGAAGYYRTLTETVVTDARRDVLIAMLSEGTSRTDNIEELKKAIKSNSP
ncbi:MAG: hypothetical protein NUW37_07205 [Planctomycetes bacterium]|nr:hypothetical protein [Planctomycetota bacterium]